MSDERLYALRIDIYDEISYHLGIDDSDDGACDAKNAAANAVLRLIERELGDAAALAEKIEAAWDWIYRTEPHPELNGDLLRGLRAALSGGESHCDRCHRPLPHTEPEQRACAAMNRFADHTRRLVAELRAARAEADDLRRQLLDETYRPEGGEIVMRELSRVKAERDELRAEVERLCADVSDSSRLIWKQAQLLTDVVNAVRGEPGRLELHSHHDAPELVKAVVAERDALSARLQAVRELLDERGLLKADHALYQAFAQLPNASLGTPGEPEPMKAVLITQTVAPSEQVVLVAASRCDDFVASLDRGRVTRVVVFDPEVASLGTPGDDDFYEDDEPVEQVVEAFGEGPHQQTAPPLPPGAVQVTPPETWGTPSVVVPSRSPQTWGMPLGTPGDETAKEADWFRETPASLAKEARWGGLLTNPDGSVSPVGSSGSASGDEKPQATKRCAAAGGTRLVALTQAANAIRNHRNEERRPEVAGLNAAAEIIDQMIRDGEGFPIGPLGVAPTPIKPVESSGSAE